MSIPATGHGSGYPQLEPAEVVTFGAFHFAGHVPVGEIAEFYGLPIPQAEKATPAAGRDQASRSGCWRLTSGSAPLGGGASAVALAGWFASSANHGTRLSIPIWAVGLARAGSSRLPVLTLICSPVR